MHFSWLQVMNQWLGIFYIGVQVKPCLEILHIILGVTEYLKYIRPLQRKTIKRCTVLSWGIIQAQNYILKKYDSPNYHKRPNLKQTRPSHSKVLILLLLFMLQ